VSTRSLIAIRTLPWLVQQAPELGLVLGQVPGLELGQVPVQGLGQVQGLVPALGQELGLVPALGRHRQITHSPMPPK